MNNQDSMHEEQNAEQENRNVSEAQQDFAKKMQAIASDLWGSVSSVTEEVPEAAPAEAPKPAPKAESKPRTDILSLWKVADETIDWTDALAHETPTDGLTGLRMWSFYHKQAEAVLSGDTKAYAEVLKKANPLGELTTFAEGISMRAPDADRVEAQFNCRREHLEADGKKYLSAMGVRIARDLLACLPVSEVGVKALQDGRSAMEVTYRREDMMHRNFSFLDPVKLTEDCGAQFEI